MLGLLELIVKFMLSWRMLVLSLIIFFIRDLIPAFILSSLNAITIKIDAIRALISLTLPALNLAMINFYFPINYFFAVLGCYFALAAVVFILKWIMKFIPTIG